MHCDMIFSIFHRAAASKDFCILSQLQSFMTLWKGNVTKRGYVVLLTTYFVLGKAV
jgi:hypothetical protein